MSLDVALQDATSERQSYDCKPEARATPLSDARGVESQTRRQRIEAMKALREELQCVADLKLYAAYLVVESGALLEHPWIKKLLDVSNRRLDPHELLKIYREDPGSLKIADLKNPNQYWMPPDAEGTAPLQSMSRCAAMRALVEKQK